MSEQFTPTTGLVRARYCDSTVRREQPDAHSLDVPREVHEKNHSEFDRWLAKRDAEVAAKAWDEGRRAEELSWRHVFDGHPVPEGEMCDECEVVNPYLKAVES